MRYLFLWFHERMPRKKSFYVVVVVGFVACGHDLPSRSTILLAKLELEEESFGSGPCYYCLRALIIRIF